MSKNIVIQEEGSAQTLDSISEIETSGQKYGSVDWVPEDETILGRVTIKQNGTVTAASKGLYAFSAVTVNSTGKAVGKKKNGQWVVVTVDGSGNLVEKGLPTKILVVTQPTKTSYIEGEDIDITGIVVKAYYSDDSEYGTVYNGSLKISPETATGTTVTVKWNRDGDKAELTITFNITVEQENE